MEHLFDFGISQEDALIENRVLGIRPGDRLLCITSAGDVPLNLLALNNIKIRSIDVSENQNFLLKIKLKAALTLDPSDAAKFLGYFSSNSNARIKFYTQVAGLLNEDEKKFWDTNINTIQEGIINAARFEKYIKKFNGIALSIIGKKKLLQLFECNSIEDQKEYFDKNIQTRVLKGLFRIIFHPKIYKKRGIASQGFKNSGERNIAEFFFNRFRDFCCSTPARRNYFLQYTFFNEILFQEALPEFLSEKGILNIRKNHDALKTQTDSILNVLKACSEREFNKFHISNISDWTEKDEFVDTLRLIHKKSDLNSKISSRYIHCMHSIPEDLYKKIRPDFLLGDELIKSDRYPFYNIVPLSIKK